MSKIIEFIKDKIYYISGATVVLIILLLIISACSNMGSSYSSIETKMVNAAKKYYTERQNKLPKEDGNSVKVTISTLIDAELLKEIKDPKNKEQTCDGFVQVKKVDNDYAFIPFLTCKGNYEPKYLLDVIKDSKLDEYGNGVYTMDDYPGEYVYRGDDVKNHVVFNDQDWRIIKVDSDNTIALMYYNERNNERYEWDSDYNSEEQRDYGDNTDYLHADIRKTLVSFYDQNFTNESKAHIVKKDICIGKVTKETKENKTDECSVTRTEKIGLLRLTDYTKASLDTGCKRYDYEECTNRNYLADYELDTWTMTAVKDNTYEVYSLSYYVSIDNASQANPINPIVYLDSDVMIIEGDGTVENPYVIKY